MVTRKTTARKTPRTVKPAAKKAVPRSSAARANVSPETKPVVETVAIVSLPAPVVPAAEKHKLVRDSFTMPKAEYELIAHLKGRLMLLSRATKKSELLRAGIVFLATLSDRELLAAVAKVPSLKTGRPKKVKAIPKGAKKKI